MEQGDLGLHGIGGGDAPCDGHAGQQDVGDGTLGGLLLHAPGHEHVLALVRAEGQQMRGPLLAGVGSARGRAISSHWVVVAGVHRAPKPLGEHPCELFGLHAREERAGQWRTGREEATRTTELLAQAALIGPPRFECEHRVTRAPHRCHHTRPHDGSFRALARCASWVGKGREQRGETLHVDVAHSPLTVLTGA